jgi:selenocysteine lyase/cysteine desulfurase
MQNEKRRIAGRTALGKRSKDFPPLARKLNGKPFVYCDGASESQVPGQVIEIMMAC